jgi:hypothetical protein
MLGVKKFFIALRGRFRLIFAFVKTWRSSNNFTFAWVKDARNVFLTTRAKKDLSRFFFRFHLMTKILRRKSVNLGAFLVQFSLCHMPEVKRKTFTRFSIVRKLLLFAYAKSSDVLFLFLFWLWSSHENGTFTYANYGIMRFLRRKRKLCLFLYHEKGDGNMQW